jgi:hypothetical protein
MGRIIPHAALIPAGRIIPHAIDELNEILDDAEKGTPLGQPEMALAAVSVAAGTSASSVQIALYDLDLLSGTGVPEVSVLFQLPLGGNPIGEVIPHILIPAGPIGLVASAMSGLQAAVERLNDRLEANDKGRPLGAVDSTYAVVPLADHANTFDVHFTLRLAGLTSGADLPEVFLSVRYDSAATGEILPAQAAGPEPTTADTPEPEGPAAPTTPDVPPGQTRS